MVRQQRAIVGLINLADLYRIQGHSEVAEPLFRRALAIFEKVLGPEHRGVAMSLNGLAQLYVATGHYEEAESMFNRAIAIFEEVLGPEDLKTSSKKILFFKGGGGGACGVLPPNEGR